MGIEGLDPVAFVPVGRRPWRVARRTGRDTREGSEPSISEVVVTKRMDKASPKLWQDAVGGDFSKDVTIWFTTTTARTRWRSFLEYEFTNTGLSGYSVSARLRRSLRRRACRSTSPR